MAKYLRSQFVEEEKEIERLRKKSLENKNIKKVLRLDRVPVPYNPMYYYLNKLFSYDPLKYWFYIAIGSRGRGKTTAAWRWVLRRFIDHGELFIWLRLTDAPLKKMARNSSSTMVPPFILKQLGIESVFLKGTTIFANFIEDGESVTKMVGIVDSLSSFYTTKGNNLEMFKNVVLDEMNRESGERTTFDLTKGFINQVESIARMRKIRILMLGNTIDDASEILGIFNFQPKEFGIYKLTRRHAIIEYMDDSEEFKEARKNSLAGALLKGNEEVSPSFTNKASARSVRIEKYQGHKLMFLFYVDTYKAYAIYSRDGLKGADAANSGLFVGELRGSTNVIYKISPFMTCEGVYNEEAYRTFYELISVNAIYYESAMIRSRFIKALKTNRTAL